MDRRKILLKAGIGAAITAAAVFFAGGFAGGRLSEYLEDDQKAHIDEVAVEVHAALQRIESLCGDAEVGDPFGFLLRLKESPLVQY